MTAVALLSLTDEIPEPAEASVGVTVADVGWLCVGAGLGDGMRPFARRDVLDVVVVELVDVCLGPLGPRGPPEGGGGAPGGGAPGGGAGRPPEGIGLGAG